MRLRTRVLLPTLFVLSGISLFAAQDVANIDAQQNGVVLSKLSQSVYPGLAKMARIEGDVEVTVRVRRDGSVESARLESGHPMLARAALDSAKQSKFECNACLGEAANYSLRYKFKILARDPPKNCSGEPDPPLPQPGLDLALHQVNVLAWEVWTCDPSVKITRFRSAKCWYLWKCEVREQAVD
jgi:TonB family protein